MKEFKSIIMVRQPRDAVWAAIRDRLPELAAHMNDVAGIDVLERTEHSDGTVRLVNLWKAAVNVSQVLRSVVDPDKLAWIDRADWHPRSHECRWRIEPEFFAGRIDCHGVTTYEPAMGGQGARITFTGAIDVDPRGLPGMPAALESTVAAAVESLVTTMIPKNFRKLTEALPKLARDDAAKA